MKRSTWILAAVLAVTLALRSAVDADLLGGGTITGGACGAGQFVNAISITGAPTCAAPGGAATSITSGTTTVTNGVNKDVCFVDSTVINCQDNGIQYTKATGDLALTRQVSGQFVTLTPLSDLITVVARRFGATQTSNIAEFQDETNTLLAGVAPLGAWSNGLANDTTTGTTVNKLAKASAGKALIIATSDNDGILGVVTGGAGITGTASISASGPAKCVFDGGVTQGHLVTRSTTTAGDCHDLGTAPSSGNPVIGTVLSATNASAGTYNIWFNGPDSANVTNIKGGGGNAVQSVALSMPGIFTVSGSPVTSTGTLTATAAGTSGGIPYFSSATALASSAALTVNVLVKGGGAGAAPANSSITDNGTTVSSSEAFSIGGFTYNGVLNIADIHSNSSSFTVAHRIEKCSGGSGNYTATMPTSPTVGDTYTVINEDTAHTCVLTRAGSQTLNGATTLTLAAYTAPTRQNEHCIYLSSNNWACEGPAT